MEFIAHRINTIDDLKQIPFEFGVELDLRDNGNRIIIQHDPFKEGEDFEEYLSHYKHGTLVLNIKCERIELRVLELIIQYGIQKYFFLDSSFPMIKLLIDSGEENIALRYSEFEGLDTIVNLAGKVRWVWVDCFTQLPITKKSFQLFKDYGYQLCLVSPELQSQDEKLEVYRDYLLSEGIKFDAVCSKEFNFSRWFHNKEIK
jgi:hypothetical protein